MDCVFCKICAKELPEKMIYQDTILSCFLPRKMDVYGHSLIVPNKHYENIFDIPEEELTHIIKFAQKISLHFKERLGATGIKLLLHHLLVPSGLLRQMNSLLFPGGSRGRL